MSFRELLKATIDGCKCSYLERANGKRREFAFESLFALVRSKYPIGRIIFTGVILAPHLVLLAFEECSLLHEEAQKQLSTIDGSQIDPLVLRVSIATIEPSEDSGFLVRFIFVEKWLQPSDLRWFARSSIETSMVK